MLKFTNHASQKLADKIDYDISITADNPKDRFKIGKNGTSLIGSEMIVIEGNTFPKSSVNNPSQFSININIRQLDNAPVSESLAPIKLNVYT